MPISGRDTIYHLLLDNVPWRGNDGTPGTHSPRGPWDGFTSESNIKGTERHMIKRKNSRHPREEWRRWRSWHNERSRILSLNTFKQFKKALQNISISKTQQWTDFTICTPNSVLVFASLKTLLPIFHSPGTLHTDWWITVFLFSRRELSVREKF